MALLDQLPSTIPWLEGLIFILSIVLVFVVFDYTVLNDGIERPSNYSVPIPAQCKQGWKGDVR